MSNAQKMRQFWVKRNTGQQLRYLLACSLFSDNGPLELNFSLLCFTGENIILFAGFGFDSLVGSPDMLAAHYLYVRIFRLIAKLCPICMRVVQEI
jgi:hypothetical protein